jgi:hypothetical protein
MRQELFPVAAGDPEPVDFNAYQPERQPHSRYRSRVGASTGWLAVYRLIAIGTLAGFVAGFLAGIWARIAMRFSGMLTTERNRDMITESQAVVGEITLVGTLFLATFAGMAGMAGGLLYVAVRSWLPRNGWLRSVSYGVLLLGAFGFVVLDPHNPDFRLFGPAWLNMLTYSLVYLICGAGISQVADRFDLRVPHLGGELSRRRSIALGVALAPVAAIGLYAGPLFAVNAPGTEHGRILLIPLAVVLALCVFNRWLSPPGARARRVRRVALFAIVAPSAVGLSMTVRSVVTILSQ